MRAGHRPIPDSQLGIPADAGSRPLANRRAHRRVHVVLSPASLPHSHPSRRKLRALEAGLPHQRPQLSRADLAALHRPEAQHVQLVRRFARDHDLDVIEVSRLRHDVVLEGSIARLCHAFGVDLEHVELHGRHHVAHRGPVHLPGSLHGIVEGVIGLDDLPLARRSATTPRCLAPSALHPDQLAGHYRFPRGVHGAGQRIAILAFGGGYHQADLEAFFGQRAGRKAPTVRAISVGDAGNHPLAQDRLARFVADLADARLGLDALQRRYGAADFERALDTFEVTMDIEIAGALAPAAEIDVYFAENRPAMWYTAIYAALGDRSALRRTSLNRARSPRRHLPPSVVSVSWGNSEANWTANRMRPIHRALELGRSLGITICCASGDLGSRGVGAGGPGAKKANVMFPASSPFALAVGGTMLGSGGLSRSRESVWNDASHGTRVASGGGVSGMFPRPLYQHGAGVPAPEALARPIWRSVAASRPGFRGRGVPDVAGYADGNPGYRLWIGGRETKGGGTSAATPLWAALVALLNESLEGSAHVGKRSRARVGWLTPLLYRRELRHVLRGVLRGNNDVSAGKVASFKAGAGWNPCTGLGVPDGERLLAALLRQGLRARSKRRA